MTRGPPRQSPTSRPSLTSAAYLLLYKVLLTSSREEEVDIFRLGDTPINLFQVNLGLRVYSQQPSQRQSSPEM